MIFDYTFIIVATGCIALGVLTGITGSFAVLRKQSLLGDSIAHASLAGITLAYLLTGSNQTEILLLGALFIGLLATYIINVISKYSRINFESAMALIMSTFFGLGFIFLSQIQKNPDSQAAGLERFLFGQAATISRQDVQMVLIVLVLVIILMAGVWKEIKLYSFDPIYAHSIGLNTKFLDLVLSGFVVCGIIMGIQMVGVVLMSALIIAPPVAARQWTKSLGGMVFLSALIGAVSGLSGTLLSTYIEQFPAGPAIVVVASVIVFLSLLLAPQRGILSKKYTQYQVRQNYEADMAIINLLTHRLEDMSATFTREALNQACIIEHHKHPKSFSKLFNNLKHRHMIEKVDQDLYRLSDLGILEYTQNRGEEQ